MIDQAYREPSLEEPMLSNTRTEFNLLFDHSPKDRSIFKDEHIRSLLEGFIDFHIHCGPESGSNRVHDDDFVAMEAVKQGLKAIVLKNHTVPSYIRAPLVKKAADAWASENGKAPLDVVGGVVLNPPVGGLNPDAVKVCADLGGRIVWTPSTSASHYYKVKGRQGGIDVLNENGEVVPKLLEIFELIRDNDMILALAHQSVYERFVIIDTAKKMGVKKILLSHPLGSVNRATPEQIAEMAAMGAYVDVTFNTSVPNLYQHGDIPGMLKLFDLIGFRQIVGGSECEQLGTCTPAMGMETFVRVLLMLGISETDIRMMFDEAPSRLLYE